KAHRRVAKNSGLVRGLIAVLGDDQCMDMRRRLAVECLLGQLRASPEQDDDGERRRDPDQSHVASLLRQLLDDLGSAPASGSNPLAEGRKIIYPQGLARYHSPSWALSPACACSNSKRSVLAPSRP